MLALRHPETRVTTGPVSTPVGTVTTPPPSRADVMVGVTGVHESRRDPDPPRDST